MITTTYSSGTKVCYQCHCILLWWLGSLLHLGTELVLVLVISACTAQVVVMKPVYYSTLQTLTLAFIGL